MKALSKEYTTLFNQVTNAIAELESVRLKLIYAQILAESLYIEEEEDDDTNKNEEK